MSIQSQRIKSAVYGTVTFEAYMLGRHLQSRLVNIGRARLASDLLLRRMFVDAARRDHHEFLKCAKRLMGNSI
jgi:hypothetical protein